MNLFARCMCVATLAAWAVAALCVQGCGTPGGGARSVQVTLAGADQFKAGSRSARLAELPDLLRDMGAGFATEVVVVVPREAGNPTLAAISGKLGAAGFHKVMFQRPRGADSFVGRKPLSP